MSSSSRSGILILTNPEDFHAAAVSKALSHKGVAHTCWYISNFPTRQHASIHLSNETLEWDLSGVDGPLDLGTKPSAVWIRRPGRPVLSSDVDPADQEFALRECNSFLAGLRQFLGEGAFWVNSPQSFMKASSKLAQLRAAVRTGLKVPATLMSNDPLKVREFVRSRGKVVYKTYFPFAWQTPQGIATVFCSDVSLEDLPDDVVLKAAPGIYQELIPKSYELRITAMGKHLFPVKLESQAVDSGRSDWRAATEEIPLSLEELPAGVATACRAIMIDLGIVFGCFDFIVTPGGDYVFVEVNESGAFLWLEEQRSEFLLLDSFCELLRQGRPDFSLPHRSSAVRLADIRLGVIDQVTGDLSNNVQEPRQIHKDRLDR